MLVYPWEFMSRFEFFEGDKISIDEAEDDICFDAKDCFYESQWMSLIGIRYIHKGWKHDWLEKKQRGILSCFLYSNKFPKSRKYKQRNTVIGSAHIFVDKKMLIQKLPSSLQKLFYNIPNEARKIEPGFIIHKLLEMFKYRHILQHLDIEQKTVYPLDIVVLKKNILWNRCFPLIRMLYLHNIFSERTKIWMLISNVWSIVHDLKTIVLLMMHSDATARRNMIFSWMSV